MIQANRKWRVGAISFLNSRPLSYGLDGHERIDLVSAVPSHLAELMSEGLLDAALLPVIDYFRLTAEALERHRHKPLVLMPDMAIACRGEVQSVKLFCRTEYENIRHVALDPASHTSNVLVRLICRHVLDISPHYRWPMPDADQMDQESDAFLLIGDAALTHREKVYYHIVDLGQAWERVFHLPMVFAAWAARESEGLDELASILLEAKRQGLAHRTDISQQAADELELPQEMIEHYLRESIRYDLGPDELAGLSKFYRLAADEELAPREIPIRVLPMPDSGADGGKSGGGESGGSVP